MKRIGAESFALVSKVSGALVSDLIKREFVDAGIFESAKTYKLSKPYLAIASFKKLEAKGGKDANKRSIKSKAPATVGKDTAGDKGKNRKAL